MRLEIIRTLFFIPRGSLLTRNLGTLVKKEHFVIGSEYLQTLLVVVPTYVSVFPFFLSFILFDWLRFASCIIILVENNANFDLIE